MNDSTTSVKSRASQRPSIDETIESLSLTGRFVLYGLSIVFAISAFALLLKVNNAFLAEVPVRGGTHTEGVIGLPQFINPLLSVTDADKDLSALIYSGLMRQMPDGTLVPDLADGYSVSPDGLTYTFTLRRTATFQDGTPVTADDVVYTISLAQNQTINSVKAANWQGITVTKVDDQTVRFTLRQPYAPFLENTTLGILPMHLWRNVSLTQFSSNSLNVEPVGSGPYKIDHIDRNQGIPDAYSLSPFENYVLGEPLIAHFNVRFYTTEKNVIDAFQNHDVDSVNGLSPDNAVELEKRGAYVVQLPLPRVFGVFFNQNQSAALAQPEVRQALNESVDRDTIVHSVLRGFGEPLYGPVPPEFVLNGTASVNATSSTTSIDARVADANRLLDQSGWRMDTQSGMRAKQTKKGIMPLTFTISTSDVPELREVADMLKEEWQRIGAQVTIKVFNSSALNESVIKPRAYDALLFGQVVNRDLDIYAFWHSSQVADPGLNIASYANAKADQLLAQIRTTTDFARRSALYSQLESVISQDTPAVFLYSPHFIYIMPHDTYGVSKGPISVPSDRFSTVYKWYVDTEDVWRVFIHGNSS